MGSLGQRDAGRSSVCMFLLAGVKSKKAAETRASLFKCSPNRGIGQSQGRWLELTAIPMGESLGSLLPGVVLDPGGYEVAHTH